MIEVTEIDVYDAEDRIDASALVLDVREADEWDAGHIPDAVWIPLGELETRREELPHDRPIVAVCHVGNRSALATAALVQWGFDAVNLAGGTAAWAKAGFDLVTDDGSPGTVT